jgi:hypothetical protein
MQPRTGHCERSVREWAVRQGLGGRPVLQEQVQGVLVAALECWRRGAVVPWLVNLPGGFPRVKVEVPRQKA